QNWKLPVCYDDDDDEEEANSLIDNIVSELPPCSAITPSEPVDSLIMEDEHLDTIPAMESDKFIKSCVENLVPNPSESEGENECDVPAGFTTFSNVLFYDNYDSDSSDHQSLSDEDVPENIYSNPLFDEEIIPIEIDQHSFNAESELIESMPNHDSSIIISSKIDSLFDEFAEIRFAKRLLFDNSSPRPPEEIVSDNSNADIKSFSPSPIPNEDSDSHMEEIDLSFNPDDTMPTGIEDDNYDSGRDIPILKELLDNYSLSLPANESYHFDIPSPYRPSAKPPDEKFSNPLFEEEIIPIKIDQHYDNAESTHDSSLIISSKIDSLLDEFAGELTRLKSVPPGINKTDCYHENEIRITKRLLYDNSSPRPPEEFVSENSNADIEYFSPSPIPVEDSDSHMEEIDLSFNLDDPMPLGIEEDDDDSERDILILEELPGNYSLSLPVNESFYFDIPLFSRHPAKPPDGSTGILNIKMMGDISDQKVPLPELMITLVSNQEKPPDLLSHRGLEFFKLSAKCSMMIHGKNIPILEVPLFHFYPLDQLKYGGNWVKLIDLKQALRGRHPMLISSLVFLFSS
nr:hypothetical protein [Tanacetum cinerariifolium]